MPRLLTAIVAAGLSLVACACADAAGAPPAVYSWTGVYAGGNFGYGFGEPNGETNLTGFGATTTFGPFAFADSNPLTLHGILGGGQIGYNWQVAPHWVTGVEADFQGSDETSSLSTSDTYAGRRIGFQASGTATSNDSAQIAWFGTARGRVGYAVDQFLVYGTGGLAYGRVQLQATAPDSGTTQFICGPSCGPIPFGGTASFGGSTLNLGWTAGAGVEGALTDNWTWKAEYLYVDLGSLTVSAAGPLAGESATLHAHFFTDVVRVGFNYRLGD